ncbi:MAG TPA: hypothetical protein VMV77_09305 [Bacteroidales bacterium]|nr:hypothetical protein [Bacteroidales bacterium]
MGISTGLIAAYNKQLSGTSWLDLTGNGNNVLLTNTTWTDEGLKANDNGEYGVVDNTDESLFNLSAGTVIVKFKSQYLFTNGDDHVLFGNNVGQGGILLRKWGNNLLYAYIIDDFGEHYVGITGANVPSWQTGTQIAMLWDRSSVIYESINMAINIDGLHVNGSDISSAKSWNAIPCPTLFGILNNYNDSSMDAGGESNYMYIFNTVKTEAELIKINANHNVILQNGLKVAGNYNIPIIF